MSELADRLSANLWDAVALAVINGYQLRCRGGGHDRAAWLAYVDRWRDASLDEFYAAPDEPWPLPDTAEYAGPSPYPVGNPTNDRQVLELFPGPDGWRSPTMLLLHGLMSSNATGYRDWARQLNALGCSAVFCHLPFHYARTPAGCVSGELTVTANLIAGMESLRQAVIELRRLIRGLHAAGAPWVGIWGMSYGAWVGSLASLLEPVATAWLLEPVADVDWMIWNSPAAATVRCQLRARGFHRDDLMPLLPLTCPSYHRPSIPGRRLVLMSGRWDKVAPTWLVQRLARQWDAAHVLELPQGHLGFRMMPAALRIGQRMMPELFGQPGGFS